MNVVDFLTRREAGFDAISTHDSPLYRLKSYRKEGYEGINEQHVPHLIAHDVCTASGHENLLAAGNVAGELYLHDTNKINDTPDECPYEMLNRRNGQINDIVWTPGETKFAALIAGDDVELWDLSASAPYEMKRFNGIDGGETANPRRFVKKAVFHPRDKAILATGDTDGSIAIWDIRGDGESPSSILKISCNHGTRQSPYTGKVRNNPIGDMAFLDDFSLYTCSRHDSVIKVWDLRMYGAENITEARPKQTLYSSNDKIDGIAQLLISRDGRLYSVRLNGTIDEFNIVSYGNEPIATFTGVPDRQSHLCLSPDCQYMLSTSSEHETYIWSTQKHDCPIIKLQPRPGFDTSYYFGHWSKVGEQKIFAYGSYGAFCVWRIASSIKAEANSDDIIGWAEVFQSSNEEEIPESESP